MEVIELELYFHYFGNAKGVSRASPLHNTPQELQFSKMQKIPHPRSLRAYKKFPHRLTQKSITNRIKWSPQNHSTHAHLNTVLNSHVFTSLGPSFLSSVYIL